MNFETLKAKVDEGHYEPVLRWLIPNKSPESYFETWKANNAERNRVNEQLKKDTCAAIMSEGLKYESAETIYLVTLYANHENTCDFIGKVQLTTELIKSVMSFEKGSADNA